MANGPVADEILYWRDEARLESGPVAPMSRGPRRVIWRSALAALEVLAVAGVVWEVTNGGATRSAQISGISLPRGFAARGQ